MHLSKQTRSDPLQTNSNQLSSRCHSLLGPLIKTLFARGSLNAISHAKDIQKPKSTLLGSFGNTEPQGLQRWKPHQKKSEKTMDAIQGRMKLTVKCVLWSMNSSKNDLTRLICENQTLKACEMDPLSSCLRGINDAFALPYPIKRPPSQHEPTKPPDGSHLVEVAQSAKEPWRKLHGTLRPASCVRPCESDQGWMCEAGRSWDSPPCVGCVIKASNPLLELRYFGSAIFSWVSTLSSAKVPLAIMLTENLMSWKGWPSGATLKAWLRLTNTTPLHKEQSV